MQQVNLYQPIFRKQKIIFSAVTMLQVIGFFIVIYGGIYGYNILKLNPFRDELQRSEFQFKKISEEIALVEKKFPKNAKSKLLENEINRLEKELIQRKKLQEVLATGSFGNVDGFSKYFEALAKEHILGTWLTGISMDKGGSRINIAGKSIDPELVPAYIRKLSGTTAFNKRVFNVLELERTEQETENISFNIRTGG